MISFYEKHSHSILKHFKRILDFIDVLQMESEDDLKDVILRFKGVYQEKELRRIWNLRN